MSETEGGVVDNKTVAQGDDAAASAQLAKWLIPSAAVLFAVMGYVVQSGQESLLGVESAERENTAYFNSAADFLREAAVRLLVWPTTWPSHFFLHRPLLVLYALIMVAAAVVGTSSRRLHKRFDHRKVVVAAALAIASVVALKFMVMDAPLLKIQNLVSSGDDSCWALVARPNGASRTCTEIHLAKGVEAWVWHEASEIAGEIVCSRVTQAAASQLPAPIAQSQACRQGIEENKAALADEFLCCLLLEIVSIVGALAILRRASHNFGATAVCLLVLFYGLTAPYAYGKVGMTQLFDYGDARLSQPLHDSYVSEDQSIVTDKGWLPGVILHKDQKGASVLAMRVSDCPLSLDGKTRVTEKRFSLSFITNTQLMSFDELNKVDLITWLATQQRSCPGI